MKDREERLVVSSMVSDVVKRPGFIAERDRPLGGAEVLVHDLVRRSSGQRKFNVHLHRSSWELSWHHRLVPNTQQVNNNMMHGGRGCLVGVGKPWIFH